MGKLRYVVEQTFALRHQFKRLAVRWERRTEPGHLACPHMLRHAAATHWLRGGVDWEVVRKLLGHASPLSMDRYRHVDESEPRAAVDRAQGMVGGPVSMASAPAVARPAPDDGHEEVVGDVAACPHRSRVAAGGVGQRLSTPTRCSSRTLPPASVPPSPCWAVRPASSPKRPCAPSCSRPGPEETTWSS
ncbi:tyrosine-type recombinase/integrase [Streptomyces pseudogriseolus]|uniref:tyrosine-type recombinase/integrase n=1 Tax=Streptomyces pseudogriseolus TaxID=36817 RepID=UPI003FA309F7